MLWNSIRALQIRVESLEIYQLEQTKEALNALIEIYRGMFTSIDRKPSKPSKPSGSNCRSSAVSMQNWLCINCKQGTGV